MGENETSRIERRHNKRIKDRIQTNKNLDFL